MNSHHIHLDGQPFHYLAWGRADRPILLFLHGFPEYSSAWSDLAQHLSDRFHCIAPDQRGFGQSWAPPEVSQYTTSKLTADMAALIAHLGHGPVTVIGHDWGAAVAYGLAMFRPDLVHRLIILNGVHPVPFQRAMARGGAQSEASQYILWLRQDGSEDKLSANNFETLLKLFSARMDLGWLSGDRLAAYRTEWARPGRMRGMVNWYRASPLRVALPGQPITDLAPMPLDRLHIRCPHLLIWGEKDTALLPESYAGLEAFAADLTIKPLPDADHWLIHSHADEIASLITDWLAD